MRFVEPPYLHRLLDCCRSYYLWAFPGIRDSKIPRVKALLLIKIDETHQLWGTQKTLSTMFMYIPICGWLSGWSFGTFCIFPYSGFHSSSQLTNSIIFQDGVALAHQPVIASNKQRPWVAMFLHGRFDHGETASPWRMTSFEPCEKPSPNESPDFDRCVVPPQL